MIFLETSVLKYVMACFISKSIGCLCGCVRKVFFLTALFEKNKETCHIIACQTDSGFLAVPHVLLLNVSVIYHRQNRWLEIFEPLKAVKNLEPPKG
jgi:hypothetical protein